LFSGTVAELEAKRITVQRSSSGDVPEEKKTFLITDATKVEGELRLSARVTIGFVSSHQGDVATRIIVRPMTQKKN
jgi:carbonic anhydrase/acetyltransferase-like protein (isoleucine patch superfamily)